MAIEMVSCPIKNDDLPLLCEITRVVNGRPVGSSIPHFTDNLRTDRPAAPRQTMAPEGQCHSGPPYPSDNPEMALSENVVHHPKGTNTHTHT